MRFLAMTIALLSLFSTVVFGADKKTLFTQKDFARMIVQQFSWSGGLTKEPADREYLMILSGKRTFRYEAEEAYNEKTDRVTLKKSPIFGEFTGKSWILGVSSQTSSTFTFLVPVSGEYDFKAVIKGDGFVWRIEDKDYTVSSKSKKFRETDVARVYLRAGTVTVKLTIPPEGAIDSFSLVAPDYTPIQPFLGWRFRDGLTAARLAEIAVSLKNSYAQLPDAGEAASPKPLAASEKVVLPPTAGLTTAPYLGAFSSEKWVRADFQGATLLIPFSITETGYYGLTINALGEVLSGSVNNTPFKFEAKQYLTRLPLGVHRFESGDNSMSIVLPPMGGIDVIEFNKKSAKPEDFMRVAGVQGPPDRPVSSEEAAKLLKNIQSSSSIRK